MTELLSEEKQIYDSAPRKIISKINPPNYKCTVQYNSIQYIALPLYSIYQQESYLEKVKTKRMWG
jgi:hypothetical protein